MCVNEAMQISNISEVIERLVKTLRWIITLRFESMQVGKAKEKEGHEEKPSDEALAPLALGFMRFSRDRG